MGFRFWRRVKIAPGLTLNLSKSGGSLSFGPRGAKFTVGPRGKRATVGLPGTGLFYTTTFPGSGPGTRRRTASARTETPSVRAEDRLTLGFFKQLVTPDDEEALVDGCRALTLGNEAGALAHLRKAVHLADGAYLAGFLALKLKRFSEATDHLTAASRNHGRLGHYFSKYGITATMSLPITDEVTAHVGADLRGVLLGLVEACQHRGRSRDALDGLEELRRLEPDDVVVKLSLSEVLLETHIGDGDACQRVVRLAEGVGNDTPLHAALLLYKARALRGLGLLVGARETLTVALRRKKGRPPELLKALRYERAGVYADLSQRRRSRSDLEKLYAENPGYQDVAERLEL